MEKEDIEIVEKLLRDTCPEKLLIDRIETVKKVKVHDSDPSYLTTVYFKNESGVDGTYEVNSLKLLRFIKRQQKYGFA